MNFNPHPEPEEFVKNMPPITSPDDINPDGLLNLAEALIRSTKKSYISTAKARFQTTGKWNHRKERDNSYDMRFVERDPYGLFKVVGDVTADDIFDAWDKEMLKTIKKGDYVKIVTRNTSFPIHTVCEVVKDVKIDSDRPEYRWYILQRVDDKIKIKVTLDDIELYPKLPSLKK